MKSKMTFWEVLEDYRVVIPMIQRDYAQGRSDSRTVQIRKSFLENLKSALTLEKGNVNLDFVYGSSHSGDLILLDGQQRFTTLFLLHWFLASQYKRRPELVSERLLKFTYETRTSTKYFIEKLAGLLQGNAIIWKSNQSLSAWIEDSHWFARSWKRDPSVAAMLNTLDDIQCHFSNEDSAELWGRLTNESAPRITFQFLNMKDFSLTDELYVKMNARGRPLSDFENFKAWLLLHVESHQFQLSPSDWAEALDIRWTDLFWKHRPAGFEEIDQTYLNFFNGQALCTFAADRKIFKGKLEDHDSRNIQKLYDNEYFGPDERSALGAYTVDALNRYFSVLDALCLSGVMANTYLDWFTQPENYGDLIVAHAISSFLSRSDLNGSPQLLGCKEFDQWLRVASNLIRNTTIDSTISVVRAVQAIDTLTALVFTADTIATPFYARVAALDESKLDFFAKHQLSEEILKCKLICADFAWEHLLLQAESHPYFDGQVGFLIEFSRSADQPNQNNFKRYLVVVSLLFSKGIIDHNGYVLQRALLCHGDYTFSLGLNLNLCIASAGTLRDRDENWRRVLRDPKGRSILKLLCDDLLLRLGGSHPDIDNVADQLKNIIAGKSTPQRGTPDDWRWILIKGESLLDDCTKMQIRRTNDPNLGYTKTYLLGGIRMSGSHAELTTYDLWLNHVRDRLSLSKLFPFTTGDYYWVSGGNEEPYAFLGGWRFGDCAITLRIYNCGNRFEIRVRANDEALTLPAALRVNLETAHSFHPAPDGSGATVRYVPAGEVDIRLSEITVALSKI